MNTLVKALVVLTLLVGANSASATLIWYSAMDGDATAGVGGDGVASGTPTAATDALGRAGGAVAFDGSGDYFTVSPTQSSFTAATISAWVRADTVDNTEDGVIAVGATGGGSTEYFSFMNRASGDQKWRSDLDDGSNRRDVLSDGTPDEGVWYHLAVTFDSVGSQQLRMYVNGVLQGDVQGLGGDNDPYDFTNDWLIGTERTGSRYFHGAIDDVRIYNTELTGNEVGALFSNGPAFIPEPTTALLGLAGVAGLMIRRRRVA